ncbi:hypothetical protein ACQW5G_01130 [Fructilactobacillus sp. Tb1]|uniref:hypothetical protein n=1 Tax=Fructilactobacillus sp. Tb1 TaxID=3422304 RepID=UPI003D2A44EC
MLETKKSINFNGTSEINGTPAMILSANVSENGSISLNANVVNQTLYNENKTEIQKDLTDFNGKAFSLSEETKSDTENTTDPNTQNTTDSK